MSVRAMFLTLALATTLYADDLGNLKVGDEAKLERGATVRFVKVVSDSRCPEGAACVWAGEATVELMLSNGREGKSIELVTPPNEKSVGYVSGWKLELVKLDPARPKKDGNPPDYRLSLAATPATSAPASPAR